MAPVEYMKPDSGQDLTLLKSVCRSIFIVIQLMEYLWQTPSDTKGDPPAYSIHLQDTRSTSTSKPVYPSTKIQLNPTNFFYIDGNYPGIKSAFMIDPTLHVPETYLSLLKDIDADAVGERMNMYVNTGNDLDLDVWIVGHKESDAALDPMRRTRMRLGSQNGSVTVKVVRCTRNCS